MQNIATIARGLAVAGRNNNSDLMSALRGMA
jgi:hypothetical protein